MTNGKPFFRCIIPIQYVVINVCVPETYDGNVYQTGPGCDGETWYNTGNANWSVGGGPANWETTIENLTNAGIIPLLYLNTEWDATTNPDDCGILGNAACAYTQTAIESEENTAAEWWCGARNNSCVNPFTDELRNFYFDDTSLDTTGGTSAGSCDMGYSSVCNETFYDDIMSHELPMDTYQTTSFLNGGNWALNPTPAQGLPTNGTNGYSSWSGNSSGCRLGESGATCGEDWLIYLDTHSMIPVVNWQGSEPQLDCDFNSDFCSGTLDGVDVGTLMSSPFPSWMTNGDLSEANFSYVATNETVQSGDQGVNQNAWLDNEIGLAQAAGFSYGYETDQPLTVEATNEATLADNEWNDMDAADGIGPADATSCAKSAPTGQPTDPAETGYSSPQTSNFQGTDSLSSNWNFFGGYPGNVTTSYWLDGQADTWDYPDELNPNGDNAVGFDSFGLDLGNDITVPGILGAGGIYEDSNSNEVMPNSVVEWCERVSNNDSTLNDVSLLWPLFPEITNIVGNGTTATVTTANVNDLATGDYVGISQVGAGLSGTPGACYDTSEANGYSSNDTQITVTSSTTFTYPSTCTDTYDVATPTGYVSMWPPELDLVETNGDTGFAMTYHYGTPSSPQSCGSSNITSVPLQDFNVFELKFTESVEDGVTVDTFTLYANDLSVATLSTNSGPCNGAPILTVPMGFDFDQENTYNIVPIANTAQQSNLAWEAQWNS